MGAGTAAICPTRWVSVFFIVCLSMMSFPVPVRARPDQEMRERFYGSVVTTSTRNASGDDSIADIFDRVLEKEFSSEDDAPEGHDTSSFNSTVAEHQVGVTFLSDPEEIL